jgi:hypothetical protein
MGSLTEGPRVYKCADPLAARRYDSTTQSRKLTNIQARIPQAGKKFPLKCKDMHTLSYGKCLLALSAFRTNAV